jgi:SP family general alpha glucoside:H+ symporter-like MFS transporter
MYVTSIALVSQFADLGTAWNWGAKAAFFYAGTNLLCNIWCWFRLPETKDRTFGEIDLLFTHRVPARKFRSTHVDRTYFSHPSCFVFY